MRRRVDPGVICHSFDGTYISNDHNYPLITVAALDKTRWYFLGAFAIVSSEKKENMDFVSMKIQEEIAKYKDKLKLPDFDECFVIADAHELYKNSSESFPASLDFNVNVQMCYSHVTRALKKRPGVGTYWNGKQAKEEPGKNIYEDITALHQIPSGMVRLFQVMEARFLDKWQKILGTNKGFIE